MKIPTDKQLYESEIATYWWEGEILYSVSNKVLRTKENVKANFEMIQQITHHKPVCLLTFVSNSGKPNKATQEYVREILPKAYKAMAMVSSSGVGKIIMNVLFKFIASPIPMKSFSDEEKAKEWLKNYL
ncbi:MAG: hypothetical protein RJA07_2595 [Bacteroidota bacterium]